MNSSHTFTRNGGNRTLYRSRDGMIFGVCKGLANYAEIGVGWVRFAFIAGMIVTGFWPMVLIYVLAAIFIKPAPVVEFSSDEDWEFYNAYTADRGRALRSLKRKFETLDRRTRQMESVVTNREYDWDRRFNSGS